MTFMAYIDTEKLDSDSNPLQGLKARIESPFYKPASYEQCVTFYFVLSGSPSQFGSLNVYAKTEVGLGEPLWSVSSFVSENYVVVEKHNQQ